MIEGDICDRETVRRAVDGATHVLHQAALPSVLPEPERRSLVAELFEKQNADGGWTLAALGPWAPRPDAPPAAGATSSYATAFAALTAIRTRIPSEDERVPSPQ